MRYEAGALRKLYPRLREHTEKVVMPLSLPSAVSSRAGEEVQVSLRLITPRQPAFHAREEELAQLPWATSLPGDEHESSWPVRFARSEEPNKPNRKRNSN